MKRGDIDMVSLDPTQGHEQRGHRPVVVVPPDAFNASTKLPVVVPITSGGGARRLGFAVPLSGNRFWLAWREVIDDDHWRRAWAHCVVAAILVTSRRAALTAAKPRSGTA